MYLAYNNKGAERRNKSTKHLSCLNLLLNVNHLILYFLKLCANRKTSCKQEGLSPVVWIWQIFSSSPQPCNASVILGIILVTQAIENFTQQLPPAFQKNIWAYLKSADNGISKVSSG